MTAILEKVNADKGKIESHFHYLHQNPGVAFEEQTAATYIAGKLREWGYEVTEGIGKTGVVGQLKVGDGKARIGLRADTDALPVQEGSDLPYKSKIEGKSHMCGHDAARSWPRWTTGRSNSPASAATAPCPKRASTRWWPARRW